MNQEQAAVGPGSDRPYAGGWRRALAAFLDNAVWFLGLSWFFGDAIELLADESPAAAGILVFVLLSLWFNYFLLSEWRWGQTIGKNATGIEVRSVDGEEIRFGQASVRNLLRLVDWLLIGPIMIAGGERKQRLGDRLARTVVVRRPPKTLLAESVRRGGEGAVPVVPAPTVTAAAGIAGTGGSVGATEPVAAPAGPHGDGPGRPSWSKGLPAISWSAREAAWGLAAGVLGGLLVAGALGAALVLPFNDDPDSKALLLVAQGLFGASLIVVAVGVASGWRYRPLGAALGRLGLRRFSPSAFGWMLLAMFAYYVAAAIFSTLVLTPEQEDIGGELGVGDETLLVAVTAVVLIAVLAPVSEELFFRGMVFAGLRSRLGFWPAAILAGVLFGLVHAPTGVTTVIPLAALGLVLAWLYEKTGSLWPCVIAHLLNNSLALLVISEVEGVWLPLL